MGQRGLFDPAEPAPDPVAREIADLRKALARYHREYSESGGERRRELDLALIRTTKRLEELAVIRKRQEAAKAAAAPVTAPMPKARLRVLPGAKPRPQPHDGRAAAAGTEREDD